MVSFGLVIEHDKLEIFHFLGAYNNSNSELDLLAIGILTLKSKTYWRYLSLYLFFKKYVCYYSTKVLSTVKVIGMFGNLTGGLLLL